MKTRSNRHQGKTKRARGEAAGSGARNHAGSGPLTPILPMAALALLAFIVYAPALGAGFIWDDEALTDNPWVASFKGILTIWFSPGRMSQEHHYWPMVYSSFWLEHRLVGLRPFLYHFDNILLHGAVAILLWRVLRRLETPGAWLGAALFAVHPIHAESVAWVIERKDVLCGVFFMGAALAFLKGGMRNAECGIPFHTESAKLKTQNAKHKTNWWLMAAYVLFIAAMLSKSIAVGLPFALGAAIWWRDGRISRRDLLALAPMVLIAAALTLADLHAYHSRQLGAFEYANMPLGERVVLASGSLWVYLSKLAWPWPLATFYHKWTIDPARLTSWLAAAGWVVTAAALWLGRKRIGRGPLAALAYYALMLGPVLGLIAFDFQVFSWVADRFQYLASAGPLALAAAGLHRLARKLNWPDNAMRWGAAALLAPLGALCFQQAGLYKDSITLFSASTARQPRCWAAWNNLAFTLARGGRGDEAIDALTRGLAAMPEPDHRMTVELAEHLARAGRFEEAEKYYRETLRIKPDFSGGILFYAGFLSDRGRLDDAAVQYAKALEIAPGNTIALSNLGNLRMSQNKPAEAERCFQRAVDIEPDVSMFRMNLALAQAEQKKYAEAAQACRKILESDPNHAEALFLLGKCLLVEGKVQEAMGYLDRATAIRPQDAPTQFLLGMAHETLGHKPEAVRCYREALRLQPNLAEAAQRLKGLGAN